MLRARPRTRLLVATLALASIASAAGCSGETAGGSSPDVVERADWSGYFDAAGVTGTFALRRVGSPETVVFGADRAQRPMIPASTFKILNTMVILETGVRGDVDQVVAWDGTDHGIAAWNRDHSLRTGIEVSAVWAFQELARRVGQDRMAEWVTRAEYGNADIDGGIERFWLSGDLRISPLGQLDFLERLVTGDLPFSSETMAQAKEIIVRERGDGWTWAHKTGTALAAEPTVGWLVGFTTRGDDAWVFALNVDLVGVDEIDDLDDVADQRVALSRALLEAEGALPAR